MEGLGRIFNVIPKADNVHVPLRDGTACTFVVYEDGGDNQATVQEGVDGSSAQDLATVAVAYTGTGVGGAWTRHNIATPLALIQKEDLGSLGDVPASDCLVFTVHAAELSDGFNTVACNVDAGECIAILHDLTVQRAPENLAALV
jgi:hypothetical protein